MGMCGCQPDRHDWKEFWIEDPVEGFVQLPTRDGTPPCDARLELAEQFDQVPA